MKGGSRESARLYALRPVTVSMAVQRHSWPLAVALVAVFLLVGELLHGSRHEPAPVVRSVQFDGYPLIGPGMTCWFKDLRPEGEIIVHDLCERFLKAYRRYKIEKS
jgi:hypothetical protein